MKPRAGYAEILEKWNETAVYGVQPNETEGGNALPLLPLIAVGTRVLYKTSEP